MPVHKSDAWRIELQFRHATPPARKLKHYRIGRLLLEAKRTHVGLKESCGSFLFRTPTTPRALTHAIANGRGKRHRATIP